MLFKLSQQIQKEGALKNYFFNTCITLASKLDKDTQRKENADKYP